MVRGFAALVGAALVISVSGCSIRSNFEGQPVPASTHAPPLKLSLAVLSIDRCQSIIRRSPPNDFRAR